MSTLSEMLLKKLTDIGDLRALAQCRNNLAPACWPLIKDGHIKVSVKREGQSARNRGRRHHQNIRHNTLPHEQGSLTDAKLMLLINDH